MKRKGLSLIEILISLAILTVIMIATMPMVTVKTKKYLESNDTGIWAQRANGTDPMHLQSYGETQGGAANNDYPNLIVGATDTEAQVNEDNPDINGNNITSTILTADKNNHEGRLIVYNRGLANRDLPAINIAKILYFYNNIINASGKNTLTITNNAAAEGYLTLGENSLNIRNRLIVQKPKNIPGGVAADTGNIVISNSNNYNNANGGNTIIGFSAVAPILPDRNDSLYIFAGQANNFPIIEADDTQIHILGDLTSNNGISVNNLYYASDKRLKNIKGEYKKGLKEVMKIQPVEFTYKADSEKKLNIGVIAQELKKIFPEAVTKRDDGYYMVKESPVFYALLNSVKELNSNYEKIKKNNDELEKQIAHLKQKNE